MRRWALAALVLATCAPAPDLDLEAAGALPTPSRAPIFHGQDDALHEAVVRIVVAGSGSCTATFLDRRHLVTAAHCLPTCATPPVAGQGCMPAPSGPPYPTGVSGAVGGVAVGGLLADGQRYTLEWVFFPALPGFPVGQPDVAILRVSASTPFEGEPLPLLGRGRIPTGSSVATHAKAEVLLLGYSPESSPDGSSSWRRRSGTAVCTGVDADSPDPGTEGDLRAWVSDGSASHQKICAGDSGGPALLRNAYGTFEIAGVHSVSSGCGANPSSFASDHAYIPRAWVDSVLCGGSGWEFLGAHPRNAAAASSTQLLRIGAATGALCRIDDGSATPFRVALLRSDARSTILALDSTARAFRVVDDNPASAQIATTDLKLYQAHTDGRVWRWDGGFRVWTLVDASTDPARALVASPTTLYQLRGNGEVAACGKDAWGSCSGTWTTLDAHPLTRALAAGGAGLFQLRHDAYHRIWKYEPGAAPGLQWTMVDHNGWSEEISVGATHAYQRHMDGRVWRYAGTPTYWDLLDDNPNTSAIVARGQQLFQLHGSGPHAGDVWRSQGCFRCWENLGGSWFEPNRVFGSQGKR